MIWTKEHDSYIRQNYRNMSDAQMGEILGRTRMSIKCRRERLGLIYLCKPWSKEEIQFIVDNPNLKLRELSAALGRTVDAVSHQAVYKDRKKNELQDWSIKRTSDRVEPEIERITHKPLPRDYKPSYIFKPIDPALIKSVMERKMIMGTYRRQHEQV